MLMNTALWPLVHEHDGSGGFDDEDPVVVSPNNGTLAPATVSSAGGSSDSDGEA